MNAERERQLEASRRAKRARALWGIDDADERVVDALVRDRTAHLRRRPLSVPLPDSTELHDDSGLR